MDFIGALHFKQIVAIKQLDHNGLQGNREFIVEVLMLSMLHHSNLVKLIGYCTEGDQRLLVYEYMSMGSLENHLFCKSLCHKMPQLMSIFISGIPHSAVSFSVPCFITIVFQSLSALDNEYVVRRGNDNECLLSSKKDLDPDKCLCTSKIYFSTSGLFFLSLQSRPFFKDRRKFVQLVDPLLQGHFSVRCLHHAIAITAMCLQEEPKFRPLIGDVVVALEYLASQPYKLEARAGAINSHPPSSPSQPHRGHVF
ncbi:hypothetical protein HHK36_010450 [Tetracentron sinense]|uniref:Protein kinase domain-containing protein n=1 Tax=Tetracentron sinense TaxID=13715 RepID=A0A835DIJ2_TETSI|nr:hypothetical protein HHK36_010450 [Tetracentron sinense]